MTEHTSISDRDIFNNIIKLVNNKDDDKNTEDCNNLLKKLNGDQLFDLLLLIRNMDNKQYLYSNILSYILHISISQDVNYQLATFSYLAGLHLPDIKLYLEVIVPSSEKAFKLICQLQEWTDIKINKYKDVPLIKYHTIYQLYIYLDETYPDADFWNKNECAQLFLLDPDDYPSDFWYYDKSITDKKEDKKVTLGTDTYNWDMNSVNINSGNTLTSESERTERMSQFRIFRSESKNKIKLYFNKKNESEAYNIPCHILGGLPELLVDNMKSVSEYPNSDIDIYLIGKQGENEYLEFLNSNTYHDKNKIYLFEKKYVASLFIGGYNRKIQFIKSGYPSHFQILRSFDYSHAKWMLNCTNGKIYGLPVALQALRVS